MAKPRVLATRRWPDAVEAVLTERFDTVLNTTDREMTPDELREALANYDAILPTVTDKLGADAFKVDDARTRILANYGVGFSHIDMERADALGICVTNTPDVLSGCTADLAMTLLLMVARRAGEGEREVRAGAWTGWRPTHLVGRKVTGKTLGIIGFGRIGQQMAKRAHFGFDMEILVQNRSEVPADVLGKYAARQVGTVEELLPQCDFISLHCPGGEANKHLINDESFDLMRPDACLINTARGEVIDEKALVSALRAGKIGGAALDVFDGEPRVNPDLLTCDGLVVLPHLGSATREAREAMGFRVIDNLTDFFDGREPRDRVN